MVAASTGPFVPQGWVVASSMDLCASKRGFCYGLRQDLFPSR